MIFQIPTARQWRDDGTIPKDDWPDVVEPDGTKRLIREGEWVLTIPVPCMIVLNERQVRALMGDGD